MKRWCIVTTSQSLFCLAVRPEALLVSRVIVTHRNLWSFLVIKSTTKSGIFTIRQLWDCWAVQLKNTTADYFPHPLRSHLSLLRCRFGLHLLSIALNSTAVNLVHLPPLPRSKSFLVSSPRPPLYHEAQLMRRVIVTHQNRWNFLVTQA